MSYRTILIVWMVGVITATGLLISARWFPIAIPLAFALGWALMVMMFVGGRTLFPAINSYSLEMQAARTFFGWFILAVIGLGFVVVLLFGHWAKR